MAPSGQASLRVGLLATLLSTTHNYRGAGLHTYSQQLLERLPAADERFRYVAFVGDDTYRPPGNLMLHRSAFSASHPSKRIFWEQGRLPTAIKRYELDLVHGLAYVAPVLSSVASIVTVHDLSFLLYPKAFRASNRHYLSRMTALSCRRAARVICVSQATAQDVQRLLHIDAAKIDVVYNGVDPIYRLHPAGEVEAYRTRAGWPERFILCVATLEPRKNYVKLLHAYARYRLLAKQPLPLLIGGGKGWYYETIFEHVRRLDLEEHVHFLGFVPPGDLPWLYSAADLFVYVSLYEGFGLPLAEAMSCGTPAITSTVSSLPEVAGEAAVKVDPEDVVAIAQAMVAVLSSSERRQSMREAGLSHVESYRWQRTATETAAVYARALGAGVG